MVHHLSFGGSAISFGVRSIVKDIATAKRLHCAYGGEEFSRANPATAEHIRPKSKGGKDIDSNFLPVCKKHNGGRGNTDLDDYLHENPGIWSNIKRTIAELKRIITPQFDGPKWAKSVKKTIEEEAKKPLDINIFA